MQRFRMVGIYLVGVVTIITPTVWGLSVRTTAGSRTTASELTPPTPAATEPSQPTDVGSTLSPPTVPAAVNSVVVKVSIDNFHFVPEELTISAGTTVTWVNTDDVPHTASSIAKPAVFDSKTLDTDDKYSFQFKTPGSYEYFCKVHPHMTGKIIVK